MALVPFQRSNSSGSSSSSRPPQWTFDAFLSFRGEDTRDNFVSHLYKELNRKGINTFKDDEKLETGKEISPELLKAIEESRFSIVVISKSYASSRWCLDELVQILECKNAMGQKVYPVFYHVDPSEVRKQSGTFGERFAELVSKHEMAKVQGWMEALKEVANLSGLTYPNQTIGSESKLIEEIVGQIFYYLNHVYTSVDEGLVGMDSRVEEVIELLGLGNDDARLVGIWGMGGIGKTTIAKAVYDRISWKFDACCFIDNVRAVSKKCGVTFLQEQLVSEILVEKDQKISSISTGKSMIKKIISRQKVLIVLDDVDESTELENLLGEHGWFSSGSIIIITTRDLHVLKRRGAIHTYKVQELKKDEAVELFKLKAFGKDKQVGGYGNLLDRAAEYCKGVPLALKVLGSFFRGREEIHWESALRRLEKSPLSEVEEVLKISYDALSLEDKEIFLDIACFFKSKHINYVIKILESFGFQPILGIELLVEKSLITVSHGMLFMHDLIQEMGRNIVRWESPKEPGHRSRLSLNEDIKHVLMNDTGTEKVEGIVMEDPDLGSQDPKDFGFLEELKLKSKAFAKMRNLRILIIRCFHLSEDLKYLSNNLRYLHWHGYPSRCMPSEFQPMHLIELHITHSNIEQLWMGTKVLYNLRIMNLSCSKYLTMSPDFGSVPNLESLILKGCTNLVNLHPSIGSLRRLVELELIDCKNLKEIPSGAQLESLEVIYAFGCSKLNILGSFEYMKCLQSLDLDGCGISELPLSVGHLTNLENLDLENCKNLRSIPNNISQLKALKILRLSRCSKLEKLLEEVGDLDCLEWLGIEYTGIRQLPASIFRLFSLTRLDLDGNDFESLPTNMNQLSSLGGISLSNCKRLQELPELSSNIIDVKANHCESLRTIASPFIYKDIQRFSFFNCFKLVENKESNILTDKFLTNLFQGCSCRGEDNFEIAFPGSDIPKWFNHQSNGSSVCFQLPPYWFNSRFLGIAIAFVGIREEGILENYEFEMRHKTILITWLTTKHSSIPLGIKSENVGVMYFPISDYIFASLSDPLAVDELNEGGEFKVKWDSEQIEVKKCGVRLVYKDDVEGNDQASSIYSSSSQDDNLVVSRGIDGDANAPLKRRSTGSDDLQEEYCRNIKRPRLEQKFNTRVTPPNKVGARKKMKSSPKRKKIKLMWMWMSTWHKRVTWIQSNQLHKRMVV